MLTQAQLEELRQDELPVETVLYRYMEPWLGDWYSLVGMSELFVSYFKRGDEQRLEILHAKALIASQKVASEAKRTRLQENFDHENVDDASESGDSGYNSTLSDDDVLSDDETEAGDTKPDADEDDLSTQADQIRHPIKMLKDAYLSMTRAIVRWGLFDVDQGHAIAASCLTNDIFEELVKQRKKAEELDRRMSTASDLSSDSSSDSSQHAVDDDSSEPEVQGSGIESSDEGITEYSSSPPCTKSTTDDTEDFQSEWPSSPPGTIESSEHDDNHQTEGEESTTSSLTGHEEDALQDFPSNPRKRRNTMRRTCLCRERHRLAGGVVKLTASRRGACNPAALLVGVVAATAPGPKQSVPVRSNFERRPEVVAFFVVSDDTGECGAAAKAEAVGERRGSSLLVESLLTHFLSDFVLPDLNGAVKCIVEALWEQDAEMYEPPTI
ncbi:hypothetical protein IWX90DRAFT_231516 [Phyllosticta citrichinensis]|uniref:Uncharacterized protein n=1 Tax=Phyllosticta citrichinensis TaxID=1130410 RepID=A0ABR1XUY3_9PEZI